MHSKSSATDFGYKIQALGGHVLLRLGYQVSAVKQSGHPDIIASIGGIEYRFEVESEVTRPRLRKLTAADFDSLVNVPNVIGYYALAITFPSLDIGSGLKTRQQEVSQPEYLAGNLE